MKRRLSSSAVRRTWSVRWKLYALGIPLAILSGTLILATVLPYRSTKARLEDARDDIAAAISAQRLGRETTDMVWRAVTYSFDGDADGMVALEDMKRTSDATLAEWVGYRSETLPEKTRTISAGKAKLNELVGNVADLVQRNEIGTARKVVFDELITEWDSGFQDELDEVIQREVLDMGEAFTRLAGEAGRTSSIFGGGLTSRIADTSHDVAQAQLGALFRGTIAGAGLELVEQVFEEQIYPEEVYDERDEAGGALEAWAGVFVDLDKAGERSRGEAVDALEEQLAALAPIEDRIIELSERGDITGATRLVGSEYASRLKGIVDRSDSLIADQEDEIAAASSQVASDARRINAVLSVLGGMIFLGGCALVGLLARRLSRRIERLTRAASQVGGGDLTTRVPVDTPDELGDLAATFNAMAESVANAQQRSASLFGRTVEASEQERTQLAADLHDGPVQRLTAISYDLERASLRLARGDAELAGEILHKVKSQINTEISALRLTMVELRPPALDERGLAAAIADYAQDCARRNGLTVSTTVDNNRRLPAAIETAVYRVIQESLTNVAKHAAAMTVDITLTDDGESVDLRVEDDGRGFEANGVQGTAEGHFGLDGMEQRIKIAGGSWRIDTRPGSGTKIIANIPIPAVDTEHPSDDVRVRL